jgi:hypothetical protein
MIEQTTTTSSADAKKLLCKCGEGPRRRGQSDCLICHRISVLASRLRRKRDLKAKLAGLQATIDKLTLIADPATRKAFEARFPTRFVLVCSGLSGGQDGFPATVVGFVENYRLLVLTDDGYVQLVRLESVEPAPGWYGNDNGIS